MGLREGRELAQVPWEHSELRALVSRAGGSGIAVKTVTLDPFMGLGYDPSPSPEPTYPGKAGLYSFYLDDSPASSFLAAEAAGSTC